MTNKTWKKIILTFLMYAGFIYLYLFHFTTRTIPDVYIGSVADPSTFMPESDIQKAITFARIRHLLFFLSNPIHWLAILYFFTSDLSTEAKNWCQKNIRNKSLQYTIYFFVFSLFSFLVRIPFQFINFQLARFYGTSFMSLSRWLRNRGIDFVIDFLLYLIILLVVISIKKRFKKKWWLISWFIFIPFAFFFMFIQPVIIDPLYNDFVPLQDLELRNRITEFTEEFNLSISNLYEVKMSGRTNSINAYVTGIGGSARIVLWDTAIEGLSEDALMFLIAHEIAHYLHRDVYIAIVIAIGFAFGGLFIIYKILNRFEEDQFIQIPVAILSIYMLLFFVSPATNYFSRSIERRADQFALEKTANYEAGIELFQTLASISLNDVHPPQLVRIFRSTHPSIFERIQTLIE